MIPLEVAIAEAFFAEASPGHRRAEGAFLAIGIAKGDLLVAACVLRTPGEDKGAIQVCDVRINELEPAEHEEVWRLFLDGAVTAAQGRGLSRIMMPMITPDNVRQ
jgi:hypothetical protein